jgi:hypothetical protein
MENTIELSAAATLVKQSLKKAIPYPEYRELVARHVQNETSTGPVQTKELSQYTLLNNSRMRRLDKTIKISPEIIERFKNFKEKQTWLVISESWCGDAAQSLPVMHKLAEITEGISMKIVLRDENSELMNAFLTKGSKSIPKLIVFDTDANDILGEWGPRPSVATRMVTDYKEHNGIFTAAFKEELQIWYNKDKAENIAHDLAQLLN